MWPSDLLNLEPGSINGLEYSVLHHYESKTYTPSFKGFIPQQELNLVGFTWKSLSIVQGNRNGTVWVCLIQTRDDGLVTQPELLERVKVPLNIRVNPEDLVIGKLS